MEIYTTVPDLLKWQPPAFYKDDLPLLRSLTTIIGQYSPINGFEISSSTYVDVLGKEEQPLQNI